MKKVKITVMKTARYDDLIKKYENPIEHACDMREGQEFIANGWGKTERLLPKRLGQRFRLCDDSRLRRRRYLRRMDERQKIGNDFL